MIKKQNTAIKHGRIIAALRRVWLYSEIRRDCINSAKVSKGRYKCNTCQKAFSRKEIQCDHIIEVGKFLDWNTFIEKLFCPIENLQVLCKNCHLIKTNKAKAIAKLKLKVKVKKK